jgi:hypothetical protein
MLTRLLLALVFFLLLTSGSHAAESPLESEFKRERERLVALVGPTSEQSCDGTELVVYLEGEQVRHLDWSMATSSQLIRRQYFFRGSLPIMVIETIHGKRGPDAELLTVPRFISISQYPMNSASPSPPEKEFREHAELLLRDFHEHRDEFKPAPPTTSN